MLLIWLTTLWIALWGDLHAGNVLGGLAVAVGVLVVARPTGVTGLERSHFRPIAALHYALYFLVQLVKSNLVIAWEIATPGSKIHRAVIRVPMHTTSAGIVTLVANSITLTPGTITIGVAEELDDEGALTRALFVHVLQAGDLPSVHSVARRLELLAVKAFGERDQLPAIERALAAAEAGEVDAHVSGGGPGAGPEEGSGEIPGTRAERVDES
jgi:multicomponent Na+:H+ antiporter subunit E